MTGIDSPRITRALKVEKGSRTDLRNLVPVIHRCISLASPIEISLLYRNADKNDLHKLLDLALMLAEDDYAIADGIKQSLDLEKKLEEHAHSKFTDYRNFEAEDDEQ